MWSGLASMMGAPAGSNAEWNAFDNVGFDQLSNEGITGSVSGNTNGMSAGNMAGLMGGGGSIKDLRTKGLESYQDMSRGDLGGLMGMVLGNQAGSQNNMNFNQQQNQRFGPQYQNPYITGLMGM